MVQISARLNKNSKEPVPYTPDCTSVLKSEVSYCANEQVEVKPNGIWILYPVIGKMDVHTRIRRHGENRELSAFSIAIFQEKKITRSTQVQKINK